jgi:mannonate dehydratase
MKLALILPPYANERWTLARQLGVTHAVTQLPNPEPNLRPWDFMPLLHLRQRFEDAGITVAVIESSPPMNNARLGRPERDREVDDFCTLVTNMGAAGIPVLCWNWMAVFGWTRTSTTTPTRGGALVTSYDHSLMERAPLTDAGRVTDQQLWDSLAYFLERVVPVAEEAKVKLALHPDDPPISPIRGVARILRTPEAMERAVRLVDSSWSGITLCQGTFSTMGADIPATIRRFAALGKTHFVHFRDVSGTPERFAETFHDDGQTDMYEAMRAHREVGYEGVMRPDHVPTMAGESNERPGYEMLGRLYAIGYMRGLIEGVNHER